MTNKFSWTSLFSDFQSREIDTDELETLIEEVVARECPGEAIEDMEYTDDGITIVLDSGQIIEIEVDWNEIILS